MPPSEPGLYRKQTALPKSGRRLLFTIARLGIGVGLIVYLAQSHLINIRDLVRLFYTAWPLTIAALALILLHIVFISWRLCLMFQPQGLKLTFLTSLKLALIGLFFEMFTPGAAGGTVAKLFYATRENEGRKTQVATVVLFDRAIGIFSLLILPLLFAPLFLPLVSRVHTLQAILIPYAAISGFLVLILLAGLWFQSAASRIVRAILHRRLANLVMPVLETIGGYRKSPATLFSALGLSLLANLSIVGVITLGVLVVHPASVAWKLCLIVPIGQLVNSLPLTPGGLGVGEIAFNTLFRITGLSGGAEAVLCWRIWSALVSSIGLYFYLRGMERKVVESQAPPDQTPVAQTGTVRRSAQTESLPDLLPRVFSAFRTQWQQGRMDTAGCNPARSPQIGCAIPDRCGIVF